MRVKLRVPRGVEYILWCLGLIHTRLEQSSVEHRSMCYKAQQRFRNGVRGWPPGGQGNPVRSLLISQPDTASLTPDVCVCVCVCVCSIATLPSLPEKKIQRKITYTIMALDMGFIILGVWLYIQALGHNLLEKMRRRGDLKWLSGRKDQLWWALLIWNHWYPWIMSEWHFGRGCHLRRMGEIGPNWSLYI